MASDQAMLHEQRSEQFTKLRDLLRGGSRCSARQKDTLAATRRMAELRGKLLLQAYSKEKHLAWVHVFVPCEILHALKIVPLNLEGFSSMLSTRNLSSDAMRVAEDDFVSPDSCSFLETSMGAMIADVLPAPDIVISTTRFCDSAPKIYYQMSQHYKGSMNFTLDVPYRETPETIDYVAEQLRAMVKKIEEHLGIAVKEEELASAIENSNRARGYFLKVNELRRHRPTPMSGREAIDYAAMLADTWGSRELPAIYRLLYQELKEKIVKEEWAVPGERHRILWLHLRPYYTDDIFDFVESRSGAVVAFEEVNHIFWEEMDPGEPYLGLAKKLVKNCISSELQHRLEVYERTIDQYGIDAVILFYHKGCTSVCSTIQMTKECMEKKGVSVLSLEGECIDKRQYAPLPTKARIEAFLEMLEASH
jgi:benzoyl-CoA reductase/2-hydroxyglutaryl-CoA dehydratase subunit BcrC/BadD/HgdB